MTKTYKILGLTLAVFIFGSVVLFSISASALANNNFTPWQINSMNSFPEGFATAYFTMMKGGTAVSTLDLNQDGKKDLADFYIYWLWLYFYNPNPPTPTPSCIGALCPPYETPTPTPWCVGALCPPYETPTPTPWCVGALCPDLAKEKLL